LENALTDTDPPLVSVVIPAHNAEAFVAEAIESVLGQTNRSTECIIVDDGSSDATRNVVRGYGNRVRLVTQPNRGVSAARNRGASVARGDLLAFLDADDVWRPERLTRMVEVLTAGPGAEAALCATQIVDRALRPVGEMRLDYPIRLEEVLLCRANLVSPSSNLLVKRTCFEAIGGFDERLSTAADWALLVHLVEGHQLAYLDEPLVLYRRHEANMSRSIQAMEHDMVLVYEELFAGDGTSASLRDVRRRAYANLRRTIAGSYYVQGKWRDFLRNALLSIASHPAALPYFLAFPARRLRARREGNRREASS
jgi:glycosyltransferase involved in cell wall biosynthesis